VRTAGALGGKLLLAVATGMLSTVMRCVVLPWLLPTTPLHVTTDPRGGARRATQEQEVPRDDNGAPHVPHARLRSFGQNLEALLLCVHTRCSLIMCHHVCVCVCCVYRDGSCANTCKLLQERLPPSAQPPRRAAVEAPLSIDDALPCAEFSPRILVFASSRR